MFKIAGIVNNSDALFCSLTSGSSEILYALPHTSVLMVAYNCFESEIAKDKFCKCVLKHQKLSKTFLLRTYLYQLHR